MGALERLEATDLACWGHLHGRCPAPAQHSVAHGLPPPRQHERMNVEGRGHRLHLHPPLTTQPRSEEHTSELQSQSNLVCRLLLEKKKNEKIQRPENWLVHRIERRAGYVEENQTQMSVPRSHDGAGTSTLLAEGQLRTRALSLWIA